MKLMIFYAYLKPMDNIQQIADAVQKGLKLAVQASVQQGSTRLIRFTLAKRETFLCMNESGEREG